MLKNLVASGGILKQVAGPMARRLGTALSGLLVGYGVAEPHASALVLALGALAGVSFDILLAIAAKKSIVEKTIAKERAV